VRSCQVGGFISTATMSPISVIIARLQAHGSSNPNSLTELDDPDVCIGVLDAAHKIIKYQG
jgi:hypothetical protein